MWLPLLVSLIRQGGGAESLYVLGDGCGLIGYLCFPFDTPNMMCFEDPWLLVQTTFSGWPVDILSSVELMSWDYPCYRIFVFMIIKGLRVFTQFLEFYITLSWMIYICTLCDQMHAVKCVTWFDISVSLLDVYGRHGSLRLSSERFVVICDSWMWWFPVFDNSMVVVLIQLICPYSYEYNEPNLGFCTQLTGPWEIVSTCTSCRQYIQIYNNIGDFKFPQSIPI